VAALPLERGQGRRTGARPALRLKRLRGDTTADPEPVRPDFLHPAGFHRRTEAAGARNLVFDICIFHHHLPNAIKMVRQCPEVRFVLDHIGKPGIRPGSPIPGAST
jgi:L-fuconolactonase